MKYVYDRDTDSLAITFAEGRRYSESLEIHDGIVVDFDSAGKPMAIEFHDRASRYVDTAGLASGREVHVAHPDLVRSKALDGIELRKFRLLLGFTQAELAERLSVGTNTIARWERGELRIEHSAMVRLALEQLAGNVPVAEAPKKRTTAQAFRAATRRATAELTTPRSATGRTLSAARVSKKR